MLNSGCDLFASEAYLPVLTTCIICIYEQQTCLNFALGSKKVSSKNSEFGKEGFCFERKPF